MEYSLDEIAEILGFNGKEKASVWTTYGYVEDIENDGSFAVILSGDEYTTRCARMCDAECGDRVLVLVSNAKPIAIARVGSANNVGTIIISVRDSMPIGYIECNGGLVSKAAYPRLYEMVQNRFGSSPDSAKFRLPNAIPILGDLADSGFVAYIAY